MLRHGDVAVGARCVMALFLYSMCGIESLRHIASRSSRDKCAASQTSNQGRSNCYLTKTGLQLTAATFRWRKGEGTVFLKCPGWKIYSDMLRGCSRNLKRARSDIDGFFETKDGQYCGQIDWMMVGVEMLFLLLFSAVCREETILQHA